MQKNKAVSLSFFIHFPSLSFSLFIYTLSVIYLQLLLFGFPLSSKTGQTPKSSRAAEKKNMETAAIQRCAMQNQQFLASIDCLRD